jgi:hypothetical protein
MSDTEEFHPKRIFENLRALNAAASEPDVPSDTEASVLGFGTDLIFTPVVGGHLNFSAPEDDSDYPVNPSTSGPKTKQSF